MSRGFEVMLHGGIDAGRDARRAVAEQAPALPALVQDDILLLVTELVTNAVRHGGSAGRPIGLELRRNNGRVHVEVADHGAEFEPPPAPVRPSDTASRGGWGLFLVDRLAETWGVRPTQSGKCVWFELAVTAPP
jgi:anti-sigma regulatory factor (Ser/Thr protein kinase)